jgi:hypothetical protein
MGHLEKRARTLLAAVMAFGLSPVPCAGEGPGSPRLFIIQPGYPGTAKDARAFLDTLSAHVAEKAKIPGLSGEYFNEAEPALKAVAAEPPAFGIVSLGFYLAERDRLGLSAHLAAVPKDRFVLVARGGDMKDASELKGQPVAGGPLHERRFLDRIVFPGKGVLEWDVKPTLHASRALRDLSGRKRYRAVVLTGRDHGALIALYPGKTLEKVAESDYYPPALVVTFDPAKAGRSEDENEKKGIEKKSVTSAGGSKEENGSGKRPEVGPRPGVGLDAGALERVVRTFSGLSGDPRGKEILGTMGTEGFEEISGKRREELQELERRYDAASKAR